MFKELASLPSLRVNCSRILSHISQQPRQWFVTSTIYQQLMAIGGALVRCSIKCYILAVYGLGHPAKNARPMSSPVMHLVFFSSVFFVLSSLLQHFLPHHPTAYPICLPPHTLLQVSKKDKPCWILLKQDVMGWQWWQRLFAPHSRQITTPASHPSVFFTVRMLFLPNSQQHQSTLCTSYILAATNDCNDTVMTMSDCNSGGVKL